MVDPFPPRDVVINPVSPTKILALPMRPSTDSYITCIVCSREHCDFEFTSRRPGTRQVQGIHLNCAETIGPVTNK